MVYNYDVFSNKKVDNARFPLSNLDLNDVDKDSFNKLQMEAQDKRVPTIYSRIYVIWG
jgi:hypothetical protein